MAEIAAMISHASQDAAEARRLCELLEAHRVPCWIAPRDLAPGEQWTDGIVRGIEQSDALVLVVSDSVNRSVHVLNEITQAVHLGKPIFPVLIGQVRLSRSLDYYLRPRHWLFADSGSFEHVAGMLAGALRGTLDWRETAEAPSFMRRLRFGSLSGLVTAFGGSIAAIALAAVAAWWWTHAEHVRKQAMENANYQSLGWATPSHAVRSDPAEPWMLSGSMVLAGSNPDYGTVQLLIAPHPRPAAQEAIDLTDQIDQRQAGVSSQMFKVRVQVLAQKIVLCLARNHPSVGTPHRVEQLFEVRPVAGMEDDRVEFVSIAEPQLVASSGEACGL